MRDAARFRNPVIRFFTRPFAYAIVFAIALTGAFVFTLLDAFVIPRALRAVPPASGQATGMTSEAASDAGQAQPSGAAQASGEAADDSTEPAAFGDTAVGEIAGGGTVSGNTANDGSGVTAEGDLSGTADRGSGASSEPVASYKDENISITVETVRAHDTDIHIADITLSAAGYLKTAFAQDTYGRNIKEDTSAIAAAHSAIFAVNGDYYGFRDDGWVLRNGDLYRSGREDGVLIMDAEGDLSCENSAALSAGAAEGLWQIWSFGPPLVLDGEISVSPGEEISGRSSNSNPRTAIGQAGKLRYIFIVSDGRTRSNAGLSLYELAELFKERGCAVAYNLDGGGSSTMYFDGRVVNNPATGGRKTGEREVSDIVYIGY
jgi:exopolysaccharide biosynthesis protein